VVFVLSSDGQPLDPCHEARARKLLAAGEAVEYRRYPYTIRLLHRRAAESTTHPHRLKLDPGSKTTGLAIVQEDQPRVVWAAELAHRGQQIRDALLARRALRRSRRQRKTRYRPARFLNRRRKDGWLPPSLLHRVLTTLTWARRLRRLCPIGAISMELVRFDTQALQNPEIAGVAYQRGTLFGWEVWNYLLMKWGHRCAYCGATNMRLEQEHLIPRSRGGSDRITNLTIACRPCNERKGNLTAIEFGFPQLMAQAKRPLKDVAAVNSARWALYQRLLATGLPVEVGTGGRTKWNRARLGWDKSHWRDAAVVGASTPDTLHVAVGSVLLIAATGHGRRQMCRTNKYGFPTRHVPRRKRHLGFKTGDLVRAVLPSGKHVGTHVGRVAIRSTGKFNIATPAGLVQGIHHRHCQIIQRADGYAYVIRKEASVLPPRG
jgi:5-methylcytosine-specific restriction endonuclease McrA